MKPFTLSLAQIQALEWIAAVEHHTVDTRTARPPYTDAAQDSLIGLGLVSERETGPGDSVLVLELTAAGREWLRANPRR